MHNLLQYSSLNSVTIDHKPLIHQGCTVSVLIVLKLQIGYCGIYTSLWTIPEVILQRRSLVVVILCHKCTFYTSQVHRPYQWHHHQHPPTSQGSSICGITVPEVMLYILMMLGCRVMMTISGVCIPLCIADNPCELMASTWELIM